ncbi:hypothetical protein [Nonomuraea sp. 10N515B]|uniref:hypothetical protein n=1 Tax=Nonomuraea sp. 10N515B TaxID=3457422 RepID=UPI003FCEABDB
MTPRTTIACILRAIEECRPQPVYLFCTHDDHERIAAACALLPSVRVVAHELVPAGALWIAKDLPDMDHEQGE